MVGGVWSHKTGPTKCVEKHTAACVEKHMAARARIQVQSTEQALG